MLVQAIFQQLRRSPKITPDADNDAESLKARCNIVWLTNLLKELQTLFEERGSSHIVSLSCDNQAQLIQHLSDPIGVAHRMVEAQACLKKFPCGFEGPHVE